MKWILGLGNPGDHYSETRHNIGWKVLERLLRKLEAVPVPFATTSAEVFEARVLDEPLLLLRSRVYMNRSGQIVLDGTERLALDTANLLVIYDDADLALGRIRFRKNGSAGGHNGIRSILEETGGAVFDRLKIGVHGEHRRGSELANYVLSDFDESELEQVTRITEVAADAAEAWVRDPIRELMNEFHGRWFGQPPQAGEETGS